MFTPQEVSEKVFPKASFGGGYSMSVVDEFLDALTEDYSTLFKENVTLKAKLKVLAEKVEEYRSTEEAMRQTLLTAQKMAAKLVQEAIPLTPRRRWSTRPLGRRSISSAARWGHSTRR